MAVYGKFVWYDLMTSKPDAAKAFYSTVFGWGTQGWDKGDYAMWTIGEKGPFGGLMDGKPGAPSQWLGYISTPDLKATIERALELGGELVVPITAISESSKFALLADPQGAQFAVFNSVNEAENDWDTPAPFRWCDLNTTDWTAARDFYVDLFNWQQTGTMSFDGSGSDDSTFGCSALRPRPRSAACRTPRRRWASRSAGCTTRRSTISTPRSSASRPRAGRSPAAR